MFDILYMHFGWKCWSKNIKNNNVFTLFDKRFGVSSIMTVYYEIMIKVVKKILAFINHTSEGRWGGGWLKGGVV